MTNFIQRGIQNAIMWAMGGIVPQDDYELAAEARQKALGALANYYNGEQRRPMKLTMLGKDYNVLTNHIKTIVDRSVSMLVGAGIDFDLPGEGDSPQEKLIDRVWEANKMDVFLHDLVQFGSIYGTPAIKIIPAGKTALDGTVTYRLIALNPYNLTVYSAPDDIENVVSYVYRWNSGETAWRELTEKQENNTWLVTIQKFDKTTGNNWAILGEPVVWAYPFPPIAHGKNLPNAGNIYGTSDIEGIIDLQDKVNEANTNINKILSLQAWAQKFIIGGKFPRTKDDKGNEYIDMSPDKALEFTNPDAKIGILQPSGDLASSRQFAEDLRRSIFDIAATVDEQTVTDKVGALTNFGLRVLYKNELAKNATKQLLYGDLFLTVNNRLLQLDGYSGANADPGEVNWGDPLPTNELEALQVLQQEQALGVVSTQTIAKARGYDWDTEQERKGEEKQATTNAGAEVIRGFLAGR